MRKTTMGWALSALAVTAVFALPSAARSQTSQGAQKAAELEAEASQFLDQRDQWGYAVDLYLAAVQLRTNGDPQAQQNLRIAASLKYETGDATGAIAALESAGSRALASGEVAQAINVYADAAWIAQNTELGGDARRLTSLVADLVNNSDLTTAERNQLRLRIRTS